jgi:hypothetical protein
MTGDEQQQAGGPFEGGMGGPGFAGFEDMFKGGGFRNGAPGGQDPFGDIFEQFEQFFGNQGGQRGSSRQGKQQQAKGMDI